MRSAATLFGAVWLLFVATARAEEDPTSAEARRLHNAAVDDFAQGAYYRAVDGFIAADRLTPRAGFLFNIAKSYDATHDAPHALAAYRGYLHQAPAAPDASEVAQRVSALSAQLTRAGIGQVSILSQPLGAQVFVDDKPVGTTPITVDLALGEHVVSLVLDGFRELKSSVKVVNEQPIDLSFSLVEVEVVKPPAAPEPEAPQALAELAAPEPVHYYGTSNSALLQIGGFVSLGAGVVALGSGIAFELMRARTERGAQGETIQTRFAQDLETISTQQTLARIFAGSGVVLAAVGGVLLGLHHMSSERKPETAKLSIACAPSDCQGVVSGVF